MVIRFLGKRLSSFQIIIAGFLGTILVGALLLMLPIAVRVWYSQGMVTLRKKLEVGPDAPRFIQTHVGIGYRMLKVE